MGGFLPFVFDQSGDDRVIKNFQAEIMACYIGVSPEAAFEPEHMVG